MIFNKLRFRTQVFLFMVLILALAFVGMTALIVPYALNAQRNWTFTNLESSGQIKAAWIESGFDHIADSLRSRTPMQPSGQGFGGIQRTGREIETMRQGLDEGLNAGKSYDQIAGELRRLIESDDTTTATAASEFERAFLLMEERYLRFAGTSDAYFDLLLVDARDGRVVFSIRKGKDFLQRLDQPPWDQDNAAACYRKLMADPGTRAEPAVALIDFERGAGGWDNEALACIGVTVFESPRAGFEGFQQGRRGGPGRGEPGRESPPELVENETVAGALLARVPIQFVNSIMTQRAGLRQTGETYLVGRDLTLRSEIRSSASPGNERFALLDQPIDSPAVRKALSGDDGTEVSRKGGKRVLRYYQPLDVMGVRWALLADISQDEAMTSMVQRRQSLLAWASVLVVVLFFASYGFARRINRPIEDLKGIAQRVGAGEHVDPLSETEAGFEFNELFVRFNEMTRQVRDRAVAAERARQAELREKEAAEAANRAKSAFLANMSHELRTPMNAIIGYSEMLQEEAEEAGMKDFIPDLGKIHDAGRHLLELINDVLDLSKIEAGKMDLYPEDFDIAEMIDNAATMIRPLAGKNGNALAIDCPPDIGAMRADLTKARQALYNLLSNACKFTEKGRVVLRVRRVKGNAGDEIHFRVSDTGIGIPREKLDSLFDAFTQADASTTRKFGGTGLGLTISRRFCRLMGGDIQVESELGKGSTFTMILPARRP